ncbi:MAG: hypothetical protein WDM90_12895 [Ferruginibacter sp.]
MVVKTGRLQFGQPTSGWASQQAWYALTVVINPANPNECSLLVD